MRSPLTQAGARARRAIGSDPFIHNEYGVWCPNCGELLSSSSEDFDSEAEECRVCGFPDVSAEWIEENV